MKKALISMLAVATIAGATTGCSNDATENTAPEAPMRTLYLTAEQNLQYEDETRWEYSDKGAMKWESSDATLLATVTQTGTLTHSTAIEVNADDNSKATFSLAVPADATELYGVYPCGKNETWTITGTTAAWTVGQQTSAQGFAAELPQYTAPIPVTSETQTIDAKFNSIGAVIRFKIYSATGKYADETVHAIHLDATNISGTYTHDLVGGTGEWSNLGNSVHTIVNMPLAGLTGKENTKGIYTHIVPAALNERTITVVTDVATYTFHSTVAKEYQLGKVYTMNLNLENANAVRTQTLQTIDQPYTWDFTAETLTIGEPMVWNNNLLFILDGSAQTMNLDGSRLKFNGASRVDETTHIPTNRGLAIRVNSNGILTYRAVSGNKSETNRCFCVSANGRELLREACPTDSKAAARTLAINSISGETMIYLYCDNGINLYGLAWTPTDGRLLAPELQVSELKETGAIITWEPSNDVLRYEYRYCLETENIEAATVADVPVAGTLELTGLTTDAAYTVQVRAVSPDGEEHNSKWAAVSVTPTQNVSATFSLVAADVISAGTKATDGNNLISKDSGLTASTATPQTWIYNNYTFESFCKISSGTFYLLKNDDAKKPAQPTFIRNITPFPRSIKSITITLSESKTGKIMTVKSGDTQLTSDTDSTKGTEHIYNFPADNDGTFSITNNNATNNVKIASITIVY